MSSAPEAAFDANKKPQSTATITQLPDFASASKIYTNHQYRRIAKETDEFQLFKNK